MIAEAVEAFLAGREHCSIATVTWYRQLLGPFAAHFDGLHIENLTLSDLRSYLQKRRSENSKRGTPRAGASLNGERKAIKALFREAQRQGWIEVNPAEEIKQLNTDHRREPLTEQQVRDIIRYLSARVTKRNGLRNLAMFIFMLDSSARRDEVRRLLVEDVDLKEGLAKLTGKGDQTRTVSISRETCDILRRYLGPRLRGAVFVTQTGTAMSVKSIRHIFDAIEAACGIHIYPHKVRRTSLVMSWLDGMDLLALSRHAGHSSLRTTEAYIHSAEEQMAQQEHREHSPVKALGIAETGRPQLRVVK